MIVMIIMIIVIVTIIITRPLQTFGRPVLGITIITIFKTRVSKLSIITTIIWNY